MNMVKVLHVEGKELTEIKAPYKFMNGDVYLIDDTKKPNGKFKDPVDKPKAYVWLGSKAFADDRGVGAWAAQQLDFENKTVDIDTEVEGKESAEFKKVVGGFNVVEGDTAGFLKHVEVNWQDVDYEMYKVYDADVADRSSTDDITIEAVPISRSSLKTDDVFIIDGWNSIYVWVGKKSQVGEKAAGNRLARKLDTERKRNPMIYAVEEGSEPKGFFEFIEKIAKEDPKKGKGKARVDPGKEKITQTDNLAKKQMMESMGRKPSQASGSSASEATKKKGFFSKIFGKK